MAKSRYSKTRIVDDKHYATFRFPVKAMGYRAFDMLEGVRTFEYTYKQGDRLDHLAARYFNDDAYWWVICLANGISFPFASGGLTPGRKLKIPYDVNDVLDKIL